MVLVVQLENIMMEIYANIVQMVLLVVQVVGSMLLKDVTKDMKEVSGPFGVGKYGEPVLIMIISIENNVEVVTNYITKYVK